MRNDLPDLDDLDMRLMRELQNDARISYVSLASKLGTSHTTVRRRFNRLVHHDVIKVAAMVNPVALGYRTILILAINAPPRTVDTLAEQLTSTSSVRYFWVITGSYDIVAMVWYQSREEYMTFFPEEFGSVPENVRIETMLPMESIDSHRSHRTDAIDVASHSRIIPTELDLRVIKGLEKSPRVPVKELAHDIGASVPSVRSSLRKLTSKGIIHPITIIDPAVFGYRVWGITLIQAHPSSLIILTEKLKSHLSVKRMVPIFGKFNFIIWAFFRDSQEMHDFLIQDLGKMSGVVHYENLVILKPPKAPFNL